MMLPTHALVGLLLALPVAMAAPEFAGAALLAGLVGGSLPDLDMYAGHRKTLHFPVYYSVLSAPAVAVALTWPTTATVAVAVALVGAAVHSVSDALGGGLEMRPWKGTSDRAVYDHYRGRWIEPRRWVGYDGSPRDFLLSATLAVPLVVAVDGPLRWVAVGAVAVGGVYAAVRRHLPDVAAWILEEVVPALPPRVQEALPTRYLVDDSVPAGAAGERDGATGDGTVTTDGGTAGETTDGGTADEPTTGPDSDA
ncbi:MAG: metal-dependent hydrolase [Halobacteriales archaeon]